MSYFNQRFLRKTYYLEFGTRNTVEAAFGFSIPPQNEDFSFPQRVSETKTFGGSVFEDYGNDTVKITLSGTTANEEFRVLYKGRFGIEIVKGEDEIFGLQKIIKEYGKVDKLKDKKITLYCLNSKNHKYWNVVINDLQIKRSKDKPLAYDYTLTCTGYDQEKKLTKWQALADAVKTATGYISSGIAALEGGLAFYRSGLDYIAQIRQSITEIENSITEYSDLIAGYITTTSDYINESLLLVNAVLESPARLVTNIESSIFSSVVTLNQTVADLVTYIEEFPPKEIYQEIVEIYQASTDEIKEAWIQQADDIYSQSCSLVSEVKKNSNQNGIAQIPGNDSTDDTTMQVYGFTTKQVSDSDTWDSLALEYYNDASYSPMLALYNSDKGIELKTGNTIRIPIINQTEASNTNNLIYAEPDKLDNYGIDYGLDSDGNFTDNQGDFGTIGGTTNLSQAINNRLSSEINSRVRVSVYGIKTTIGSVEEAGTYVIASIEDTLMNDPRVKTVDSITFKGEGDDMNISVYYTDINGDKNFYGGKV